MLINTAAAIFIFGMIILIHEFGHFLFAKISGIGVIEFSIGMGPRICSFVRGETRYSIKCLPFGGSCMMIGEDSADQGEKSFQSKPVLSRIAVVAAGPAFNLILAFFASMIIVFQIGHDGTVMADVMQGYPAEEAGMQAGDRIVKIDNRRIGAHRDISLYLYTHPGKTVTVTYDRPRGGEWTKDTVYERRKAQITPKFDNDYQNYMIGVIFYGYQKAENPLQFLSYSAYEIRYVITSTLDSLGMLFRRQIKADEAVAGPVKIVSMVGETVGESREAGPQAIIYVIANWVLLLSTSLGIMNLLPLPALDGGRLLFLLIELIRGKAIDPEREGMVHAAGMILLMAMMVWILCNDILDLMIRYAG